MKETSLKPSWVVSGVQWKPRIPIRTLTFHRMGLMDVGSGRLLGLRLHGVVVFVPVNDDGCICAFYIICLAYTLRGQKKTNIESIYIYLHSEYWALQLCYYYYIDIKYMQTCMATRKPWDNDINIYLLISISDGMPLLTIAAAGSCTTHGVPCATLPALTAGQTGASSVIAVFITSAVFIVSANTQLQ